MFSHRGNLTRSRSKSAPKNRRRQVRIEQLEPRAMMAVDAILHWNSIMLQAEADDKSNIYGSADAAGPTGASRAFAIVSVAMFDAMNSIKGKYEPYLIKVAGSQGANIDAAIGQAAHDTLVSVYPKQASVFDADLTDWLGDLPDSTSVRRGIALGKTVAQACMNSRANDHSDAMMNYSPTNPPKPGHHQVDPLHPTQPFLAPNWGDVTPFGMVNVNNFKIPAPPALNSQAYTDAYNQVMSLGAANSTTRTQEQTNIGLFWAYDGTPGLGTPPRLYNQIAQTIANQQDNTEYENARMFALINVAMADAGIACWDMKYTYDFWRPIVAIRGGATDGNPNTVGDTNWTPLGAPATNGAGDGVNFTPPFPSYASGHATFGGAVFQTLADFYGTDHITFSFASDELNGINKNGDGSARTAVGPRTFTSFSAAAEENAMSRIYLGIHWIFDATSGIAQGDKIANFDFSHILQPIKHGMPAGVGNSTLVAYLQTMVAMQMMGQSDNVNRQVVMLTASDRGPGTVYTATSLAPLFPVPGVPASLKKHSQVVYSVNQSAGPNTAIIDHLLVQS
jgi:hypothetical protein